VTVRVDVQHKESINQYNLVKTTSFWANSAKLSYTANPHKTTNNSAKTEMEF
jgi:hypothetical protein